MFSPINKNISSFTKAMGERYRINKLKIAFWTIYFSDYENSKNWTFYMSITGKAGYE